MPSCLLLSFQHNTDSKQALSETDNRREIMDSIANDRTMFKEMMEILLNSKYSNFMQMENHAFLKMMKQNHKMASDMMSDMMKTAKSDTSMMNDMCNSMMRNQHMKIMMLKKWSKKP